ncbi:16S rRNA U1498 N3-methylase RsmE (RsmE) [Fructobacillus tropaeoli]|uniref:RsmE family RNA methyltransferase n=1 Tax=Fructobacillus tropaeoli TaxID=709323 RepID=UPI002D911236|nr:16S rRNA U1498 N3-methylase RsmE (RsmE) [Fructobacillus tropaeoli]
MQRYFLEEPIQNNIILTADMPSFKHLVKVLRAKVGTKAEFFDDQSRLVLGQVEEISPDQATITVLADIDQQVEFPVEVTLVVSPIKKDRNEWLAEKATELGASRLLFVPMERSVVSWNEKQEAKQLERLRAKAVGAAEQSHRLKVPEIHFADFAEVLALEKDQGLVAWEESAKQGEKAALVELAQASQPGQHFVAVFGPEGGLTEEEINTLQEAGYRPGGLGPRILRAETAPLYTLAALSTLLELEK